MSNEAKVIAVHAGSKLWDGMASLGIYFLCEKLDVLFWLGSWFGKGQ